MKWNDVRTCFLLCLVAGLFDFGITFICLSNGFGKEGDPIAVKIIDFFGLNFGIGLILLWFLAGMIVLFYYGDKILPNLFGRNHIKFVNAFYLVGAILHTFGFMSWIIPQIA